MVVVCKFPLITAIPGKSEHIKVELGVGTPLSKVSVQSDSYMSQQIGGESRRLAGFVLPVGCGNGCPLEIENDRQKEREEESERQRPGAGARGWTARSDTDSSVRMCSKLENQL